MADDTLRYVKFDYDSHLDGIIQRIRSRYPGSWNDFSTGNFGRILLDAIAFSTASTAYTINRAAGENYIPTMTLRESALRIGELTQYKLRSASASSVKCSASLQSPASADVTISKGTPIKTADNALTFEVDQDYTILTGDLTPISDVVSFDPDVGGSGVIQSLVKLTNGSPYADVMDTTVSLPDFVTPGQTFRLSEGQTEYTVIDLTYSEGASRKNRMVLANNWNDASVESKAEVVDRTITLVQGQTVIDQFITPPTEAKGFAVKLTKTPMLNGSEVVTINQEEWSGVDSLYFSSSTDKAYEVSTLPSGYSVVEFGNEAFGAVVPIDALVNVEYRVGGGSDGNIPVGAINSSLIGLITSVSSPVNVLIVNEVPGSGGLDAETLEEARINIPAHTRTNDRAVTKEDFETLASNFYHPKYGQVRFAIAYSKSENDFLERNIVCVSAWTLGVNGSLVPVTGGLKSYLLAYLQTKCVGTDYVILTDGTVKPLPVSLRFKVLPGYSVSDVSSDILDALVAVSSSLKPGKPVVYSDLVKSLDNVPGVDSLIFSTPNQDLYPSAPDELFSAPDGDFRYDIAIQSSSTEENVYSATLPIHPLSSWSFDLFLGGTRLSVSPGSVSGTSIVSGSNLSSTKESTVDLMTGKADLVVDGIPGNFQMSLTPVVGYESERQVSVYIGYKSSGESQSKRREVRSALKSWISGFQPGATLYTSSVTGIPASSSNVSVVVSSIQGIQEVVKVAFDSPTNSAVKIDLQNYEIARFASIVINGFQD